MRSSVRSVLATLAALSVLTTSALVDPDAFLSRADFRLPLEVLPVSYKVHLTPSLEAFTFDGRVEIATTPNVADVKTITLHVHSSLTVRSADVLHHDASVDVKTPLPATNQTNDFFVLTLQNPINQEGSQSDIGSVVVILEFFGFLNDDMVGFYRSSYLDADGRYEYLAATQFEATDARMAFPCFDEPALKATFELSVTAPPGYSVLGNTPTVTNPVVDEQGRSTYTFIQTPKMSTYLVATVVSKFDKSSTQDPDNNVWSRPTAADQRSYTTKVAASIMDAVMNITGVTYVTGNISKMDNVAVPDFRVGAMENWGLVTYRQTRLLVDESETPTSMRKQVAGDLAHEYGHQFFGDLVTPKWWNFIWLNEAFASYIEYHANALVDPTWRMDEQFVVDEVHQALDVDSRITTRAMTVDEDSVLTVAQISAIFDDIAYAKGGAFVRMVEHILGTQIFRDGLKKYLTNMALKAATEDDLFNAMAEAAGTLPLGGFSLPEILKSWTNTVGYPLLTVTRDYNNSVASVVQTRFLTSGSTPAPPSWITPVNWATSLEEFETTKPTLWLNQLFTLQFPVEEPLLNSSEWVVVNNLRTGFYRVNYDGENWRLLTDQLLSNHSVFPPVTQAQLLDDGFALARTGQIDYSVALGLTLYLDKQDDLIPWTAALNGFSFIKDRLTGSRYYEYFQKYMHKIMGPLFKASITFTPPENSTHTERLLISKIVTWECQLGNSQCTDHSKSLLLKVNDQGISQVPADVRAAVYCEAVRSGGSGAWKTLWTHYTKTLVASEEMLVLQGLACSTDEEILRQYLQNTTVIDSRIRKQDYRTVYTSVCNNPKAFNVLTKFVTDQITAGNVNGMSDIVTCLASKVNNANQSDIVKTLATQLDVDVSMVMNENLNWIKEKEETVGEWLEKYSSSADTAKLSALGFVAVALLAVKSIFGY